MAQIRVATYIGQPFDADNTLMVQDGSGPAADGRTPIRGAPGDHLRKPLPELPFGVHDLLSPLNTRVTGYVPDP